MISLHKIVSRIKLFHSRKWITNYENRMFLQFVMIDPSFVSRALDDIHLKKFWKYNSFTNLFIIYLSFTLMLFSFIHIIIQLFYNQVKIHYSLILFIVSGFIMSQCNPIHHITE
jgi:hypothetical protein